MNYKGALLKGLTAIPSSSSLKLKNRQPKPKNNLLPNWLDLPPDVTVLIMQRIDWYDVLLNVKEVCKYWHRLSKEPSIWRVIDFRQDIIVKRLRKKMGIPNYDELWHKYIRHELTWSDLGSLEEYYKEAETKFEENVDKALQKMAMHVIDLSCGHLTDLCFHDFGSDDLFKYIYQRSSQLKRLRLEDCQICCFNYEFLEPDREISQKGMIRMLRNLPSLEELELPYTRIFGKGIRIIGRCCPRLKKFTLDQTRYGYSRNPVCDKQALAIAKSMPGLRHLQLFGNRMTVTGLKAILKNCHHLEYLDLRKCDNLYDILEDQPILETKLLQQMKHVKFPGDSTEDYGFDDQSLDSDGHIGSDDSSFLTDDEN